MCSDLFCSFIKVMVKNSEKRVLTGVYPNPEKTIKLAVAMSMSTMSNKLGFEEPGTSRN